MMIGFVRSLRLRLESLELWLVERAKRRRPPITILQRRYTDAEIRAIRLGGI
jgi:hypothetical protein